MANRFEELERAGPSGPPPEPPNIAPAMNRFQSMEAPVKSDAPVAPNVKHPEGFMGQLAGFLRIASNSLTLGGRDRIAGMLPGNDYATEEAKTNQFRKDSPYTSIAGEIVGGIPAAAMGAAGVARAIPSLAGAAIPNIMAREAIVGGAMPAIEDVVRGRVPDPVKAGTGAVLSGGISGAVSALAKLNPFSGSFAVRNAGSEITTADKAAMKGLSATGNRAGIPLNLPELATEVAPGRAARVESLHNYNSRMKEGEIAARNFDEGRRPLIENAVRGVKDLIGNGPANGLAAKNAADSAIARHKSLVDNSAKPYYDDAMGVVVPGVPKVPAIVAARKEAFKTPIIRDTLKGVDKNSIQALDEAQHRLEASINRAEGDGRLQGLLIDGKKQLLNTMDEAAPSYATARDIQSKGRVVGDELAASPIGTVSKTTNPSTQANSVLKVDSPAEVAQSMKAIEHLRIADPSVPGGLLATRVDEAAANPVTFGRKLMPTKESGDVIADITGPDKFSKIQDVLTASRARDASGRPGGGENADGPISGIWNSIQNMRSGNVVRMLQDPATIDKLNTVGPIHGLLNSLGTSGSNEVSEPLVITVKPKAKKREEKDDPKLRRANGSL